MKTKKIQSLNELRQAKRELAIKRKLTRQAFGKQLKVVRHDVKSVLIKKVLLPVGIGVIGGFAIKYFFASKNDKQEREKAEKQQIKESDSSTSWFSILSIIVNALRIFQGMMHDRAEKEQREQEDAHMAASTTDQQQGVQEEEEMEEPPLQPKDFVSNYQQFVRERSNPT